MLTIGVFEVLTLVIYKIVIKYKIVIFISWLCWKIEEMWHLFFDYLRRLVININESAIVK